MSSILLVNPPVLNPGKTKKLRALSPPLGLLSLAAYVEQKGISVQVIDLALEPEKIDSLKTKSREPQSLVGITSTTNTIGSALTVAETIKRNDTGAFIVMGGPHPSVLPDDVVKHSQVDCAVIGEGESILLELFNRHNENDEWHSTPGIAYMNDGKVVVNPPGKLLADLDDLSFPARHLVPFKKYKSSPIHYKRSPSTAVITSRGCPFKCTFCSNPVHGRKIRFRSPENIVAELKHLKSEYGIRDFNLFDDTFTVNRNRVINVCELMIKEKLDLTWSCGSRVDTIDPDVLKIMKRAGCWFISFGIESGSERLRKLIKKGITEKQIFTAFRYCKEAGIESRAFFMLGLPTETEQESEATISFARKLDPDFMQFSLTVPYPGSEIYDQALAEGWFPPEWEKFQTYPEDEPVYVPAGRSGKELRELQNRAFKSIYFRPAYILKRLTKLRSWAELRKYVSSFFELLKW
jgi:anaerobic magnesium-protoporphyrin IX monomethyl ester cyclase